MVLSFVLCVLVATTVVSGTIEDPFTPGPYDPAELIDVEIPKDDPQGIDAFNMHIYAPSANGSFPIIYFVTGFQDTTLVTLYSELLTHIASHGYVVLGIWVIFEDFDPDSKAREMVKVVDWSQSNLVSFLQTEHGASQDFDVDFDASFLFGQSSGNHITVSHLVHQGCRQYKGIVMLNPVDGVDPLGIIDDFIITEGELVNFQTPSLTIMAGLDPAPGAAGLACAPAAFSNEWFYNAMHAPRWFVNATDFGHADCMNKEYTDLNDVLQFCASDPDIEKTIYKRTVGGLTVSFIDMLLNDCAMRSFLEDPSQAPINLVAFHDAGECGGIAGSCSHDNSTLPFVMTY